MLGAVAELALILVQAFGQLLVLLKTAGFVHDLLSLRELSRIAHLKIQILLLFTRFNSVAHFYYYPIMGWQLNYFLSSY